MGVEDRPLAEFAITAGDNAADNAVAFCLAMRDWAFNGDRAVSRGCPTSDDGVAFAGGAAGDSESRA